MSTSTEPLTVTEVLREQARRRLDERSRIRTVVERPVVDEADAADGAHASTDDDGATAASAVAKENGRGGSATAASDSRTVSAHRSGARRAPSPCSAIEESATVSQLKSRVALLENEADSLRAVVDLARREVAVLRDVLLKVAAKSLGDEWRCEIGIDIERGSALVGMGYPSSELTIAQKERLIELIGSAPKF